MADLSIKVGGRALAKSKIMPAGPFAPLTPVVNAEGLRLAQTLNTSGLPGPGGSVYFTSAITVGNYPTCGFDANWNGAEVGGGPPDYYNSTVIEDATWDAGAYLRTTYVPGTMIDLQHYLGVGNAGLDHTIVQGETFFAAWQAQFLNLSGGAGSIGGKFMMVGDGFGAESRVICNVFFNKYGFSRNIDGNDAGAEYLFDPSVRHRAQLKVKSSRTALNVVSITRSGSTATLTTSGAHDFSIGEQIEIRLLSGNPAGENEYENYPNNQVVTGKPAANQLTFTVTGSPNSPANATYIVMSVDAVLALYVDNFASEASPVAISTPNSFGLSVGGWGGGLMYGGYMGAAGTTMWNPPTQFRLGKFKTAGVFMTSL